MEQNNQTHWISLSDLMTGLMMVFMLIAASFMLRVEQTTTLVVKEYQETKSNLSMALQKEFAQNLKQWNAEMLGDMTIRFKDPNVLFDTGSATVKPAFKEILKDFMPRYIKLVTSEKYKNSIKEIRIEGHTSKRWASNTDELTAYIKNMRLSQERSQSTLEYILSLPSLNNDQVWIRQNLTANGFSSSKPIIGKNGIIDADRSQRVEFRIITNADERMQAIAEKMASK
ncbi:MAG TPA: OmpA family protein [Gammaproteobacteria bacterium]|jgi:outer membrane protein OmpA-like peptidoglycan-associated protein|nr:OmpA family protein [Gammaproteobacteria bacterium]